MRWWAYEHTTSGKIIVRRYLVDGDLKTADQAPYIRKRTDPFMALNMQHATVIAMDMLNENQIVQIT